MTELISAGRTHRVLLFAVLVLTAPGARAVTAEEGAPSKAPTPKALQKFWHDHYDAMKKYYSDLDHVDWVAYYKNHSYDVRCACPGCCNHIQYAPVFISPTTQWPVPKPAPGGGR